ncbi:MAG: DUF4381 domain-containing protein [Proteobacteria bacterium]|nr:DUF4381 domain-containing protein [Pseudomonadota bacterium]
MDPQQIPLRDLHLPDVIGWWPLAPGWWLVIGLAAIGLILLVRRMLRTRAQGAARRHALRQLNGLLADYERHHDVVAFGAQMSGLLRRTMLAYAPRQEVAGLTGDEWLAWLDRDLEVPQFVNGPGRALLALPYRDADTDSATADIYRLVTAVRQRVATPVRGKH